MSNLTLNNFAQNSKSVKPDKLNNFLDSMDIEALDDAASAAVNGGINLSGNFELEEALKEGVRIAEAIYAER